MSKTVKIKVVETKPEEGDWYQVEVYFRDEGPYAYMWEGQRQWRAYGLGSLTLDGVMAQYVDAKEVYAKVRIKKTTSSIITEDER